MKDFLTNLTEIVKILISNYFIEKKIDLTILEKCKISLNDEVTPCKLEVSILFEKLTGLIMGYDEIKQIVNDSDGIWIIYSLKKTPGLVEYSEGKLQYKKDYPEFLRGIEKYFSLIFFVLMIAFIISSFVSNPFYMVLSTFMAVGWINAKKSYHYYLKIDKIVNISRSN
jgi:hypothetical protein